MLIKRITLLVIIFILSLSAPALAAEPDSGIIEGQLVNGTEGGSSVADQDITLKIYLNDAETGDTTTTTNTEGRFAFNGLSTVSGYSYQVTVTFQDADYNSDFFSFDEGETTTSTEVMVYDATTSDEAIKVEVTHTIIYVEPGSLTVAEYYLIVNEADRTYIGSEGTKQTLKFPIPGEATDLQYSGALMVCCVIKTEDGFVDTMPVLPGSKELAYSYRVDYSSEVYTFSQRVDYPTASYELLVQGETVQITSDQLVPEGSLDMDGIRFNHTSGSNFAPGDTLVARLSGLPAANDRNTVIWVALTLLVLVGGVGLTYQLRKQKLQPVKAEDDLDQKRQRLLVELAQLDDDFEGGKIPENVYRRRREASKAQLVEFTERAKEESGRG